MQDFEEMVRYLNWYHTHFGCNELYVAAILLPPKLAWFPDKGTLQDYNTWDTELNSKNGVKGSMPNFPLWGTITWTDNWEQVRKMNKKYY